MKIRKATKKDLEDLNRLYRDYGSTLRDITPKRFQFFKKQLKNMDKKRKKSILYSLNDKKTIILIVKENDKIVGMISGLIIKIKNDLFLNSRIFGYLQYLFVEKKFRGKGIANKLKKELFNWFKKKKCDFIRIEVGSTNPAKKIYKKWGFEEDAVKMIRKLK